MLGGSPALLMHRGYNTFRAANKRSLQQRVREVERERDTLQRDYKGLVAQVRGIDLEGTMRALAAQDHQARRARRVGAGGPLILLGHLNTPLRGLVARRRTPTPLTDPVALSRH